MGPRLVNAAAASPAQGRRGRDADAGSGAAPVEGDRDGAGEVLLPRLREDQPGAGTVPCRCKRLGWPKPAGDDHVREVWSASAQSAGTLIIDQPEDDLDNRVIMRIVELLRKSKSNRQLIFSTHNSNIVVNGDADKVIALKSAEPSSNPTSTL